MATKTVLAEIKKDLDSLVGKKVRLKANKGRKKIVEREGVLEKTYPHIFVVKIEEKDLSQRVSYSYTDILTETVELIICREQGEKKLRYRVG